MSPKLVSNSSRFVTLVGVFRGAPTKAVLIKNAVTEVDAPGT
jgi:hypothetical protein